MEKILIICISLFIKVIHSWEASDNVIDAIDKTLIPGISQKFDLEYQKKKILILVWRKIKIYS